MGTVEIPFPSEALGLETLTELDDADIRLLLSREGADYAECMLILGRVDLIGETAQFKVDIRERGGVVTDKRGSCDVEGLPEVEVGDDATSILMGDTAEEVLVEGVFYQKR